ncbi:DUF5590 domain-containing protein [Ligilactobacillus equi]|uniref:Cell wall elongation regulator TseB-like domain-containing protein n=2 Tax=Ligilactobacillus equi TaxID=137357 RepID=V7HZP8_9LACO|nr:DUF5590 domain-containing protein [Ligilactobacillus equi]ETA74770.1 hypothetical protein LEQ_0525c [Ligilactobacillus equi DPC 6820]KRL81378.1 hypothetical protein FC36_GL001781 [Ligilactobacillus equi DSM 15833 = JCM 10991]
MRRTRKRAVNWRNLGWILTLITVLGAMLYIYIAAQLPYFNAKRQAQNVAAKYAKITKVDDFYWFERGDDYYAISGRDQKGESYYVVMAVKDRKISKVNIYSQNKGISVQQARQLVAKNRHPQKITQVALGMWTQKKHKFPVWEVTYYNKNHQLCYDVISFKEGTVIQTIQNL